MSFFYNFVFDSRDNFAIKQYFDMGKVISFILCVSLLLGCCCLVTVKTFSQTSETTKRSNLFNEGGYVRGITPARAIGLAEALLGILSIVLAVRAKKRSSIAGAKTSLTLGLLAIISCIVHFVTTAGAVFGSGSGKAGAIVAAMLSLVGIILSRLVLSSKKI